MRKLTQIEVGQVVGGAADKKEEYLCDFYKETNKAQAIARMSFTSKDQAIELIPKVKKLTEGKTSDGKDGKNVKILVGCSYVEQVLAEL